MIAYRAMPAQLSTTITQPTCNNADFADPLGCGPADPRAVGYRQVGMQAIHLGDHPVRQVIRFVEKPGPSVAQEP